MRGVIEVLAGFLDNEESELSRVANYMVEKYKKWGGVRVADHLPEDEDADANVYQEIDASIWVYLTRWNEVRKILSKYLEDDEGVIDRLSEEIANSWQESESVRLADHVDEDTYLSTDVEVWESLEEEIKYRLPVIRWMR